jgi:hypothetical protein
VARQEGKYRGSKPGTTKAKPARALKLRARGLAAEKIAKSLGMSRNLWGCGIPKQHNHSPAASYVDEQLPTRLGDEGPKAEA